MPDSLVEHLLQYWRNPRGMEGRSFNYFIPEPADFSVRPAHEMRSDDEPSRTTVFGCEIVESSMVPAGMAVIFARTQRHGVSVKIPKEPGAGCTLATQADLQHVLARHIQSQIERHIQSLLYGVSGARREIEAEIELLRARTLQTREIDLGNPWPRATLEAGREYREGVPAPLALQKPKPWAPIAGLKTMFHARGRFFAPDGRRFDYIFPELRENPGIPPSLLPSLLQLKEGALGFTGRITAERDRLPLRYWNEVKP